MFPIEYLLFVPPICPEWGKGVKFNSKCSKPNPNGHCELNFTIFPRWWEGWRYLVGATEILHVVAAHKTLWDLPKPKKKTQPDNRRLKTNRTGFRARNAVEEHVCRLVQILKSLNAFFLTKHNATKHTRQPDVAHTRWCWYGGRCKFDNLCLSNLSPDYHCYAVSDDDADLWHHQGFERNSISRSLKGRFTTLAVEGWKCQIFRA